MAQSMKLSKSACVTTRRCDAFVPAHPSLRGPSSCSVATRHMATAPANRELFGVPSTPRVATRVAAADAPSSSSTETKQWYALVANAEFFFNDVQNESIAEQLRERVRFFKHAAVPTLKTHVADAWDKHLQEQNREIDFWLVPEPKWLDSKYPAEAKKVGRPCVALVSTDEMWITFMKLRLDRVLRINLGVVAQGEALAVGGKIPEFKKPEKWTAPYSPYSSGWWNVFLPSEN